VSDLCQKRTFDSCGVGALRSPPGTEGTAAVQNFPFPATCAGHDWINTGRSNVISEHDPMTFDQEQGKQLRYCAPGYARLHQEYELKGEST